MRSKRASSAALLIVLCALAASALPARAEEEAARPGWTAGLDARFGAYDFDTTSSVSSEIAPDQSGVQDRSLTNGSFRIGADGVTPVVLDWLVTTRLFAGAGLQLSLTSRAETFGIGQFELDQPEQCIAGSSTASCRDSSGVFAGEGSAIDVDFRYPGWYARAGLAFDWSWPNDTLFRLRTSVEYVGNELGMTGALTTVLEPAPDEFAVVRSRAFSSATDHRIGPGIELELLLGRSARPVTASIYFDTRFLWPVGETRTTFSDPDGVATYSVERNFGIGVGGGLRVLWMGAGG